MGSATFRMTCEALPTARLTAIEIDSDVASSVLYAKADALAGAMAVCQPSVMESFSLVLMEAWLARVPVLVNGACAVTREHVQQSRGGLYFHNYATFEATVDWLWTHREQRLRLGENGRRYVIANYSWDAVVNRFQRALEVWQAAPYSSRGYWG